MSELRSYIEGKLEDYWQRARRVLGESAFQQWRRAGETGGDSEPIELRRSCSFCGAPRGHRCHMMRWEDIVQLPHEHRAQFVHRESHAARLGGDR